MKRRLFFAASTLLCGAACVDLFHSTDFDTLCAVNPAACAPDGNEDGDVPDAPPDATVSIDLCAPSSAEAKTRAARACAWLGACEGALESNSFNACVQRALFAYDCTYNPMLRPQGATAAAWNCLGQPLTSCEQVTRCVFGNATGQACTPKESGTYHACTEDKTAVVACGQSEARLGVDPCVMRGQRCAIDRPPPNTSYSLCTGGGAVGCSDDGGPRCEGTFAVDCRPDGLITVDQGVDCAAFGGGACVRDDAGAACAPPEDAGPCVRASSTAFTCLDGGKVERCVGGKSVTLDCSALGLECDPKPGRTVHLQDGCEPRDGGSPCKARDECLDGGTLRTCIGNEPIDVDCKSLGFEGCQVDDANAVTCHR